jgi:hypothetical protein
MAVYEGRGLRFNEVPQPAGQGGFKSDCVSWAGGAKKFDRANAAQFQVSRRLQGSIALGHDSRQLGRAFHQEHAGKKRLAGEMAAQKWLVTMHIVFPYTALARIQGQEPLDKPEFFAVGQAA